MRTQREVIKNMMRRHGRQPQPAYYRFWNDPPEIIRPLLPPYMEGANDILKTADVEAQGPLERITDHRELDIVLQGVLFGRFGLSPARPETGGMVATYKTEGGLDNWRLELFRRL